MPALLEIEGFFVCQVLDNKKGNRMKFVQFCANRGK